MHISDPMTSYHDILQKHISPFHTDSLSFIEEIDSARVATVILLGCSEMSIISREHGKCMLCRAKTQNLLMDM